MTVIDLPSSYIQEIDRLMFAFLWGGIDKIKRKTIIQNVTNGGSGLTDSRTPQKTIHIQRIRKMNANMNQPWAKLYVYWLGITLRFYHESFAQNTYVHTMKIPRGIQIVKSTILQNRNSDNIWEVSNINEFMICC